MVSHAVCILMDSKIFCIVFFINEGSVGCALDFCYTNNIKVNGP